MLKLTLPTLNRVLGPVSGGDQTELALEITYSLVSKDLVLLIPDTKVRATLIYVDGGADTSAEDQRVAQLKRSLEGFTPSNRAINPCSIRTGDQTNRYPKGRLIDGRQSVGI